MSGQDNEFIAKLIATFRIEAEEHLSSIVNTIFLLEKDSNVEDYEPHLESIHRETHSLKGAARAVNLTNVEIICRTLEDVFSACKQKKLQLSTDLFDTIHQALDVIVKILGADPLTGNCNFEDVNLVKHCLDELMAGRILEVGEKKPSIEMGQQTITLETVRIPMPKLASLLLEMEEMISIKLLIKQRLNELSELKLLLNQYKREQDDYCASFKKASKLLGGNDGLSYARSELDKKLTDYYPWSEQKFKMLISKVVQLHKEISHDSHFIDISVDNLLNETKKILLFPFSSILNIFPKVVRDLAKDSHKEIDLVIKGDNIEIDRRILDEIKDSLIHIVRNAVDHGILIMQERQALGKKPNGTITITISQLSAREVEIVINDDGQGVDIDALKLAAVKHGILSSDDASLVAEDAAVDYLFYSGVSTKGTLSDLSGHGLGMAIAKEKVEKLGGNIFVESQRGIGTTFKIKLPVTLSTFKGILCQAENESFIVPTHQVERVLRVKQADILLIGNQPVINLAGEVLPLFHLSAVLSLPRVQETTDKLYFPLLVVRKGDKLVALFVDEIVSETEILVKTITGSATVGKIITAATVLGSGHVVPILNMSELDMFLSDEALYMATQLSDNPESLINEKEILLVDDSITTRMLLKNILETAGYRVTTAVDGIDALNKIKRNSFALLVTDIEMPNMDGFGLIERIRADKALSTLPVIIITTRESKEDRIRGIDVGADAYIVKKGLNDTDLIEVISELI